MRVSSLLRGREPHTSSGGVGAVHPPEQGNPRLIKSLGSRSMDPENAQHGYEKVALGKRCPSPCTLSGIGL